MNSKYIIGIDVGTSGVKVIAVDKNMQILSSAVESYPLHQPKPGWTEQDPADWWQATLKALKAVTAACPGLEPAAIGLSGQMHGMVALDKDNQVIRPAILWNDQRTSSQCEKITELSGGPEDLLQATNNQMLTGYTGGKILWMKETEPENYAKTALVINPKDYIRYLLTGVLCTDVSDASGFGLYDVKNNTWAKDLIKKVELDLSVFPDVVESGEKTGQVTLAASKISGLPAGLMVIGGGGDAVISTTGLGLVKPGQVGITLGTSGVVAMNLDQFTKNPQGSLQVFRGNAPATFTAMGVTLNAAGSYEWFRNALGRFEEHLAKEQDTSAFRLLDNEAVKVPAGAEGLVYMPYLNGERCPIHDANAKGGFIGLTSRHGIGHFARSVLEGVAFSLRQVYDLIAGQSSDMMDGGEVVLAGGGAASPLWRQIFADVFNMPVRTVYGSAEGGAFGAALVAGVSCGCWKTFEEAASMIKTETTTLPQSNNHKVYKARYAQYTKLYDALKWSF